MSWDTAVVATHLHGDVPSAVAWLRLHRDGVGEIVGIAEHDVAAGGAGRREASGDAGSPDGAVRDIEALRIGTLQEGGQPDCRRIRHLGDDLADGRKAERIIVARPNDVEKNGFVARLRNAATDGVVTWRDRRIHGRARAQSPGEQNAGD